MTISEKILIVLTIALSSYAMVLMYEMHQNIKQAEESMACNAIGMVSVGDGLCAKSTNNSTNNK